MSYLTDEPFSPEEEKFYKRSMRQYNYQKKKKAPETLITNAGLNKSRDRFSIARYSKLVHDYYKIAVRSNAFMINQETYNRILQLIKGRYNNRPYDDLLVCDSITFMPIPNETCSLYYYPFPNAQGEQIEMQLIGSFVNDNYHRKLTISCPFTDSWYGKEPNLIFNFFGNDKTGKIIPKQIQYEGIQLRFNNKSMPFLSSKVTGCFMLTGVEDTVGFNVSYNVNPDWNYRYGVKYVHPPRRVHHHVPHQIISGNKPGDVGYEISSQDFYEDPNEPDPLLEAFK